MSQDQQEQNKEFQQTIKSDSEEDLGRKRYPDIYPSAKTETEKLYLEMKKRELEVDFNSLHYTDEEIKSITQRFIELTNELFGNLKNDSEESKKNDNK